MEICTEAIAITTTGSAGSAAGTGKTPALNGYLEDIYIDFGAGPATTDTTITTTIGGVSVTLWAIANSVTDVLVAPRAKPVDNANAAITNAFEKFALNGPVAVALAQCDALSPAATVYVRYARIA